MFEAFGISALLVAVGEIGDKTQLLALLLAVRFRRPVPILFGILVATLANHGLAGLIGGWVRAELSAETLRWVVGLSFLGIAGWALIPDTMDEDEQLATVALAARFDSLPAVVVGTTFGMMIADAPAVLFAERLTAKLSFKLIRYLAAGLFALIGIAALLGLSG
jgi:putative Ca2+/H+ antiporter (TMEM165/GDT1 family)